MGRVSIFFRQNEIRQNGIRRNGAPSKTDMQYLIEGYVKFTRECGGILVCQYPLGQTLENHPEQVHLLNGIVEWSYLFYLQAATQSG